MVKKIQMIVFFGFFSINLISQVPEIFPDKIPAPPKMVVRVKQFAQFIERFNYEKNFYGNDIDSSFSSKISRKEYISLLFNNELFYNNAVHKVIQEFINKVCYESDEIFLDEHSENILIEARCLIEYKGTQEEVTLFLNQEKEDTGYKWVIIDIRSDILSLNENTNSNVFLSPISHELNFTSLQKALTKDNNLKNIVSQDYVYNELSAFLFLISVGQIKFLNVVSKRFHILDIESYYIIVEEFNRDSINSGWLISEIGSNILPLNEYMSNLK